MAHRNRERRAAKKAREAERSQALYEDFYDDHYEDEPVRKRRGPHPALIALIVTVAIVAAGYYGLMTFYERSMEPVDPNNTREVTIIIPQGAGAADIADILRERGLIKNAYFFRIHCQRMGYDSQFKYGEYELSKSMSVDEIAEAIIAGVALAGTKRFTIPEGYNIKQIARTLAENGIVSEDAFYDVVRDGDFDYTFLEGCPPGDERLEGFLYPETYEVFSLNHPSILSASAQTPLYIFSVDSLLKEVAVNTAPSTTSTVIPAIQMTIIIEIILETTLFIKKTPYFL